MATSSSSTSLRATFIVGRNEIEKPSPNKLENLRPQHFLDALMVRPIDLKTDQVIIENFTDEDNAFYILHEVHEFPDGHSHLSAPSGSTASTCRWRGR